ncbi:MAG: hypothetical protein GY839_21590 [candidate division Zixibacteria bacterium]|nr:hypothetical protein [candidate division Zixibacteria bacterium]
MSTNKMLMILSLLLLALFSGCSDKHSTNPEPDHDIIITGGNYYGMCIGYCDFEIQIIDSNAVYVARSWDDSDYPDSMLHSTISIQEWQSLVELIDMETLLSLDSVIGCPDCVDQGGEWIEIKYFDQTRKITFDPCLTIEPIQELIDAIRTIRIRFYRELFPTDDL